MAGGVQLSRTVAQLLGLAGLTPQHPDSYITAWRNRCLPSTVLWASPCSLQTSAGGPGTEAGQPAAGGGGGGTEEGGAVIGNV